jgi:SAM-dependent methyltransferase
MENRYTDGTYLSRWPEWFASDSSWKAHQIDIMIKRHSLTPSSVAEVGCGVGTILEALSLLIPDCKQFDGYDISPQAIELCAKRSNDRLHFHLEDFTKQADRADLLLVIDVVEHVEDYFGFLRAIRPRANKTIFHIPLELNGLAVVGRNSLLWSRREYGHLHYFGEGTAQAALRETGLQIVDSFLTRHDELPGPNSPVWIKIVRRGLRQLAGDHFTQRVVGGYSLLVLAE